MPFSALVCSSLIYDLLNMKQGKWHYGPELYESADRPDFDYRYRDGLYAADLLTAALAHLDFFTGLTRTRPTLIQSADLSDYKNGQRT